MTEAQYIANGNQWYTSDVVCKASFSGNANGYNYSLAKNQVITVRLGDSSEDFSGASTNCSADFVCGTKYIFRVFAHATSTLSKSAFASNLTCSTLSCEENCTYTQGYWKTHGPIGCNPSGGSNIWPVTSLTLGTVSYTDAQLCSIFGNSVGGNGLINIAHQLIAAKLNVANGATSISAIADADALIGGLNVETAYLAPSVVDALVTALNNYNNGADLVPHCD